MSKFSGRVIYLDGFAGPGIYQGGEPGSPVIALQTAIDHKLRPNFQEIVFVFIEKDSQRAEILEKELNVKFTELPGNMKFQVIGAEFAPTLQNILEELEEEGAKLELYFFCKPFPERTR